MVGALGFGLVKCMAFGFSEAFTKGVLKIMWIYLEMFSIRAARDLYL